MSQTHGYLVIRYDTAAYIRAQGLANMANAPTLDAFLTEEIAQGLLTACVDLSECNGMDSTFMGILVGFHHRLSALGGRMMVVNPSPGNRKLLDMLGVSSVLPVLNDQRVPAMDFIRLEAGVAMNPMARAELMKRAHESLMRLSAANQQKFAPFLAALERDIAARSAAAEASAAPAEPSKQGEKSGEIADQSLDFDGESSDPPGPKTDN